MTEEFLTIIKSWGWRIKRVGTTQVKLAKKAGVGITTLNRCCAGKGLPTMESFVKIETTLKSLEKEKGII